MSGVYPAMQPNCSLVPERAFTAIGSILLAWLCLAAAPGTDAQPAESPAPETRSPAVASTRFDLNFPGGSPHALVKMLQAASGEPVNALIPPEGEKFTLPPLNYRNVTVEEVLAPLRWSRDVAVVQSAGGISYQQEGYEWRREAGVWVMRAYTARDFPEVFQVEPVNVRLLLAHYTIDDLTTAIDSAWKLQGAPADNQLLFHAETSLLILKGRPVDIDTARKVLKSLEAPAATPSQQTIKVNVLGQVNQPGTYTLPANGTLVDAIAKAGGETRLANLLKVTIRRKPENAPQSLEVNLRAMLHGDAPATPLHDGDTIVLSERVL